LALLRHWLLDEGCRLVAVLGMGGIGKTMLTATLARWCSASRAGSLVARAGQPPMPWLS
jgi:hypothetical protein